MFSFNGQTITYDTIGNPLNYRDGYVFTWADGRKLSSVTKGTDSYTYTYNSDGLRTSKTVNGVTTDYYWINGVLGGQKTGSEYIIFLYDENGSAYGFLIKNGTTEEYYYYTFNAQGDVIGIIDNSGTLVVEYTYSAWGELLSITGTLKDTIGIKNPLRYRGYYYDSETGFYYLKSRYYDPIILRFVNGDSQLNMDSLLGCNMFAYCENNPVMYFDPYGKDPGDLFDTMDEAARDAALYMREKSFEETTWEYATTIYSLLFPKFVGIRIVRFGVFRSFLPVIRFVKRYTYREPVTSKDSYKTSFIIYDNDIAVVHTHPMGSGQGITKLSSGNFKVADDNHVHMYVYGPDGVLLKYNHKTKKTIPVYDDLPQSKRKPWLYHLS